jgi:phosphosulfolactate synthase (CoM biosynthesis protein A)
MLPDVDVRRRLATITLHGFTDDEEELVSKALDDICNNTVGHMMFMLSVTKKPPGELTITNIGPQETKKLPVEQTGSSYWNYDVRVNLILRPQDRIFQLSAMRHSLRTSSDCDYSGSGVSGIRR